jgi:molybdopterin converting factor small subunit
MQVRIPGLLRSYTKGADTVALDLGGPAPTLADALADLDNRFPGFRFRIVDEQQAIRPHIKIFLDGELARDLTTAAQPGSELIIVGALSGG